MKKLGLEDLADLALLAFSFAPAALTLGETGSRVRRLFGALDHRMGPGRRRSLEEALSQAFPGRFDDAGFRRLGRLVVENRWNARELFWLRVLANSPRNQERVSRGIRVEGRERFDEAIRRKRGVILWESHFGNKILAKATLAREGIAITQVHGAGHGGSDSWLGKRLIQRLHRSMERGLVADMIVIQEGPAFLRSLQKHLRENGVLCMPGMGSEGRRFVELELLGRPQPFATGVVSLAVSSGAALIPIFCFPESSGGFRFVFEEPIELDPTAEREAQQVQALSRYAQLLERYIGRYPEHWKTWARDPVPREAHVVRAGSATGATDLPRTGAI